jgi:hypothetical protein
MDDKRFDRLSSTLAGPTSRRQAFKLLGGGILGGVVAVKGIGAATAAPKQMSTLAVPVTFASDAGSFVGSFGVHRFVPAAGGIQAVGRLTGTVTDAVGAVVGTVDQPLRLGLLPTTTGTCEILNLVLGPLDLNLLGLVIQLDQIVLNITAESGPGNLLGNLLCAIAGLLDGGVSGNTLAQLLNDLLDLLG